MSGDRQFGAALRAALKERGMTAVRLGELVFCDESSVRGWTTGRTTPSLESLGRIREIIPGLPRIETSRDDKPEHTGNRSGATAARYNAFWAALGEVGAAARDFRLRHVDVRDPELGAGQILGREGDRTLVMFNNQIKWLGADTVASIRVEA